MLAKILNNLLLLLELLAAILIGLVAFKKNKREHWFLASIFILFGIVEAGLKVSYSLCKVCLAPLNVAGNIIMIYETIVLFYIYSLLSQKKTTRYINLTFAIIALVVFLLLHFSIQPIQNEVPVYATISLSILFIVSLYSFLKEKLTITYVPRQDDNFWIFISTSFLFNLFFQLPQLALFNFSILNFNTVSIRQWDLISYITYMGSSIYYILLIRACYEYR